MRLAALGVLLAGLALGAGPDRLVDFDENVHRKVLTESKGQVVLFDFWATWCAPCREEMPRLVEIEQKYRSMGFRLVTVSADEPDAKQSALEFLREHGVPGPAYYKNVEDDEKLIDSIDKEWYGALPALFLYDRTGKRVESFIGETESSAIEAAINGAL